MIIMKTMDIKVKTHRNYELGQDEKNYIFM